MILSAVIVVLVIAIFGPWFKVKENWNFLTLNDNEDLVYTSSASIEQKANELTVNGKLVVTGGLRTEVPVVVAGDITTTSEKEIAMTGLNVTENLTIDELEVNGDIFFSQYGEAPLIFHNLVVTSTTKQHAAKNIHVEQNFVWGGRKIDEDKLKTIRDHITYRAEIFPGSPVAQEFTTSRKYNIPISHIPIGATKIRSISGDEDFNHYINLHDRPSIFVVTINGYIATVEQQNFQLAWPPSTAEPSDRFKELIADVKHDIPIPTNRELVIECKFERANDNFASGFTKFAYALLFQFGFD